MNILFIKGFQIPTEFSNHKWAKKERKQAEKNVAKYCKKRGYIHVDTANLDTMDTSIYPYIIEYHLVTDIGSLPNPGPGGFSTAVTYYRTQFSIFDRRNKKQYRWSGTPKPHDSKYPTFYPEEYIKPMYRKRFLKKLDWILKLFDKHSVEESRRILRKKQKRKTRRKLWRPFYM